jgi:hypothetical protein
MGLQSLLGDSFAFYTLDVRTAQETHLCASTACYGDSVTYFSLTVILFPIDPRRYCSFSRYLHRSFLS